ncbi:MAG: ABC transporter permease [Saprospiraceae bacterium]|nr:ABC transporter permease [Saprospiraceae bacterium]
MLPRPPNLAVQFLQFFLKEELKEEVLGDLHEKYLQLWNAKGRSIAAFHYWFQVLHYIRPFAIRSFALVPERPFLLFGNYVKTGYRNILRVKQHAAISIFGLWIGMISFVMCILYIQYESHYDEQFARSDQIYRVAQTLEGIDFQGSNQFALAPWPLALYARENFAEVLSATTLQVEEVLLRTNEDAHYEQGIFADAYFLTVFDLQSLHGSLKDALSDPKSIILTTSLANKLFASQEVVGKTLILDRDHEVVVKAIVADPPRDQHWQYSYITPVSNFPFYFQEQLGQWNSNSFRTYLLLEKGVDHDDMESNLEALDRIAEAQFADLPASPDYFLQPLTDIHLHSQINMEIEPNGDIRYLYLASSIAFVILLLALVNYTNLTNARLDFRTKEVGLRKVLGAKRPQIMIQFLLESTILMTGCLIAALVTVKLILPPINEALNLSMEFRRLLYASHWWAALFMVLFVGVSSGLYPGILIAVVQPIRAVKGSLLSRGGRNGVRNAMIVGQFALAVVLTICSIVVYSQLRFLQENKLGFERSQIVYVPFRMATLYEEKEILESEIVAHPAVYQMTITENLPLETDNQNMIKRWEGNPGLEERQFYSNRIDFNYVDMFGLEIVEGRNLSHAFQSDLTQSYLLNERAVQSLGWNEAVGKKFEDGVVVGVVKDFHFQPLHQRIEPLAMCYLHPTQVSEVGYITMSIDLAQADAAIPHIRSVLRRVLPELPFDLQYLDESYLALYRSEERLGIMFTIGTIIALVLACMGLFGIVSHHVNLRMKEISMRKILGSSTPGLISLISGSFVRLIALSILIAVPLAYFFLSRWIEHFAYRVELNWTFFATAGMCSLCLALLSISSLVLKAVWSNPLDSVRST